MASDGSAKLLVAMVGLPARGKSYISKKLVNYFTWQGSSVGVFNVGKARRAEGSEEATADSKQGADFFAKDNKEAAAYREALAMGVLGTALEWVLDQPTEQTIAIFDATNTTFERRAAVVKYVQDFNMTRSDSEEIGVLFVESVCTDKDVIRDNMLQKISNSMDYKHMAQEAALEDLGRRMKNYQQVYQELQEDEDVSYIKVMNIAKKVEAALITGNMQLLMLGYLVSIHLAARPIWLVRSGNASAESGKRRATLHMQSSMGKSLLCDDKEAPVAVADVDLTGFDAGRGKASQRLTTEGKAFAAALADEIVKRSAGQSVSIVTSTTLSSKQTVNPLVERLGSNCQVRGLRALNTFDMGPREQLLAALSKPEEKAAFLQDRFRYRCPGGESFEDLVRRLHPVVLHIERSKAPVVVVSHLVPLRTLAGYFTGQTVPLSAEDFNVPEHAIVELVPVGDGWSSKVIQITEPVQDALCSPKRSPKKSKRAQA